MLLVFRRIVFAILTFGVLVPELYVLALPDTSRFCAQHLLTFLIVTTVFTLCMLGKHYTLGIGQYIEVCAMYHVYCRNFANKTDLQHVFVSLKCTGCTELMAPNNTLHDMCYSIHCNVLSNA